VESPQTLSDDLMGLFPQSLKCVGLMFTGEKYLMLILGHGGEIGALSAKMCRTFRTTYYA
jgi:hypothetical protein